MEQKNYHTSITANVSAKEAFAAIADVSAWWAKSFTGRAQQLGDTFGVQFGTTTVDFEITEAIPDKKITWLITACHLPWLKDKTEWTGTKIVWEVTPTGNATRVDMTHVGLVPEVECYENCESGWNRHIAGSLFKLLTERVGQPT